MQNSRGLAAIGEKMPNYLCDIFIYIRDAPATYLDNGIAGLPGRAGPGLV